MLLFRKILRIKKDWEHAILKTLKNSFPYLMFELYINTTWNFFANFLQQNWKFLVFYFKNEKSYIKYFSKCFEVMGETIVPITDARQGELHGEADIRKLPDEIR